MMEYQVTDRSQVMKELEIQVPAEEVSKRISAVSEDFAKSVRVPGFRKGRAPISLIRTKFASDIRGEVVERIMPDSLQKALAETRMSPVGQPRIIRMDELSADKPFSFTVAVEILPEVELADYSGISYERKLVEVTDEEINAEIEGLRNRAGVLSPVEGAASKGSIITVDVTVTGDEIEEKKTEGHELTVGSSPIDELNERAVGASAGDVIEFDKQWDDDAPNEAVRGKLAHYVVEVKEVKRLDLPEVDDELAKTVGFGTLEEMKLQIRSSIEQQRSRDADNSVRAQLSDGLLERHELEVPSALVEEETNRSLQEYARYLVSQGIDPRFVEIDWARIQQDLAVEAEKRVKRTLILDAIAKKENLTVSDEEVERMVLEQAGEQDGPEVLARLKASDEIDELKVTFIRDKAMKLVEDAAVKS